MTIKEIRNKYPEAKNYTDEKIESCYKNADILSRMFIDYLEKKLTLDYDDKK